jgi:hypothetical protein
LQGKQVLFGPVGYVTSKESRNFEQVDPFKKLDHYEWQKEYRFVWPGTKDEIPDTGAVIDVPEVIPLLTRIF